MAFKPSSQHRITTSIIGQRVVNRSLRYDRKIDRERDAVSLHDTYREWVLLGRRENDRLTC